MNTYRISLQTLAFTSTLLTCTLTLAEGTADKTEQASTASKPSAPDVKQGETKGEFKTKLKAEKEQFKAAQKARREEFKAKMHAEKEEFKAQQKAAWKEFKAKLKAEWGEFEAKRG